MRTDPTRRAEASPAPIGATPLWVHPELTFMFFMFFMVQLLFVAPGRGHVGHSPPIHHHRLYHRSAIPCIPTVNVRLLWYPGE